MANGNIGDVPASSFAELLSGPMIDIFVGGSKRHWALHRNLLCHHSELLESELYGDGKKKPERLDLPDHDPAGFELLVKWLYQGKLDDVSDISDPNQKYDYAVSCHKLYLLCERFDMPQLKNVAIDQYRKGLNQAGLVPDADEINDIYRQSPVASPFRRLMTRIAARQIMDPESHRDVETYRECFENSPDFAVDLVNAIKTGTGGMLFEDPTDGGNECEYHDHEAGPNCHIKGKGKVKQGLSPSPRPEIRQIHSIRKLGPTSPPSPPSSSHSQSSASSQTGSPTRRSKRRPSPPSPDQSGILYSRDDDRIRNGISPEPEGAEGQISQSDTPTQTPIRPIAGRDVTPSPRRPPPKLRRRLSPSSG